MRRLTSLAAAVLLASGCSMIPEYQAPEAPVAGAVGASQVAGDKVNLPGWRALFPDPQLQSLVETALANNRDLRVALLNVAEARALYRIEGSGLYPDLSVGASGTRQRVPGDLSGTGQAETGGRYDVQFGLASYELDLFGRVRSLEAAALESYLASEEISRAAHITLVAEVANAYLTLMADHEKLRISEQAEADQQRAVVLVRNRYRNGLSTELSVRQAEIALETARAYRAQNARLVALDRNALSVLVGAPLPLLIARQLDDPSITSLAAVPDGLPSTVLTQRPDVRAAEHRLRAADANIGAARAAFFPRIALTAGAGTASSDLSGLFEGGSGAWSFSPSISLPIFTGGRNQANLEVAEVRRDRNVAQYEQVVQTAFQEVADALAARQYLVDQERAQDALVTATERSLELAEARFSEGVDDYLAVLDARRALLDARQERVSVTRQKLANRVQLYRALGGGASADEETLLSQESERRSEAEAETTAPLG
ncbi:efflux transporter outer membrane subunit [Marinobacter zhejiangensis]|uniref:Outer membrane protein, multidrug efflux system n=1 Tax=Marinobacter zhejiangensis TaxID=488535 RepID=A0A1I4Q860_9GAMM|nr:efflux transporter outer membrane subunit [Marinobacter zhejiangensis]SFM36259.1 outer membrane protein, multidrug efflux system [Marinobacter zhejiangensis]